jgi:hypothetical protein
MCQTASEFMLHLLSEKHEFVAKNTRTFFSTTQDGVKEER